MTYLPVTIETDWVTIGLTFLSTFLGICASGVFSIWLFNYQYKKEKIVSAYSDIYAQTTLFRGELSYCRPGVLTTDANKALSGIHNKSVLNIMYIGKDSSDKINKMVRDAKGMNDLKKIDATIKDMQDYILDELKINLKIK